MDNKVNTEETVLETAAAETEEKASAEGQGRPQRRFNNDRRRGGRDNRRNERPEKEFEERVVKINRIAKVVKGGRRMRFAALVPARLRKSRMHSERLQKMPSTIYSELIWLAQLFLMK